jgi:hypothetical protein
MLKSALCICCLKKQERFFKSKGKDIVCYKLKTLDKLKEVEEKERQIEAKHIATKAIAKPFNTLALLLTKANPSAKLKALLLLLKV